jgi:ribosomal protein S18 acetylase RimI-like enzyme
MGIDDVAIIVGKSDLCYRYFEGICHLHDSIFLAPPFAWNENDSGSHDRLLRTLLLDDSFGVVIALAGSEIVGFAYGHALAADHRWWTRLDVEQPADFVAEWPRRTFGLIDLGVHESHRRMAVGTRMVESLLSRRPEERAVLSVQLTAAAAHRFYQANGWRYVARKGPIPGVVPHFWDIYLRIIPRQS